MYKKEEHKKSERRRYKRESAAVPIRYFFYASRPDEEFSTVYQSATRDIGGGGVCLSVNRNIPVSTFVELEIILPANKCPVEILGKAVWSKRKMRVNNPYDVGLEFMDIAIDDRKKILEYVSTFVN